MNLTLNPNIICHGSYGNSDDGTGHAFASLLRMSTTIPLDAYGRQKRLIGVYFDLQNIQASWSLNPTSMPVPPYGSGSFSIGGYSYYIVDGRTLGINSSTGSLSSFNIPYIAVTNAANIAVQSGGSIYIDYSLQVILNYWDDRPYQYYNSMTLSVSWSDVLANIVWQWETAAAPPPGSFTQSTPQMVSNNVSLSWTASQYAAAYKVFRATGTYTNTLTGTWSQVASGVSGLSYTDSTVSADTTYTYYIQSSNESGAANSGLLSILTTHAPSAFTQSAPSMSGSAVSLGWAASTYATSYQVYRAEGIYTSTTTGSWSQVATGLTGTTYSDTTIVLGHTYSYYIKAVNGGGTINSDFKNITTAPPSTFSQHELSYAAGTYNVVVAWDASTSADHYKVFKLTGYSADPSTGSWTEQVTTTSALTWTDTAVTPGVTYSYYIEALNVALTTNSNPRQISVGMQQQQIL
jgi:hypothetical protein